MQFTNAQQINYCSGYQCTPNADNLSPNPKFMKPRSLMDEKYASYTFGNELHFH
jgi:hypothetical protein